MGASQSCGLMGNQHDTSFGEQYFEKPSYDFPPRLALNITVWVNLKRASFPVMFQADQGSP